MSTVGPRPALPAEVATYNDYQRQRLLVKPGLTCYWQTRRNRDSITFDEWVDLDLWCLYYVRLAEGGFKWRHAEGGELLPQMERRQLLWLLEGLPAELPQVISPVASGSVL